MRKGNSTCLTKAKDTIGANFFTLTPPRLRTLTSRRSRPVTENVLGTATDSQQESHRVDAVQAPEEKTGEIGLIWN